MIIKSLSRKKPTFKQLYEYITDGAEKNPFVISKNLYNVDEKENILNQFEDNSKNLKFRSNGVYLYHEIISLPEQKDIALKKQKEILNDLANKYLEKRINLNLAFGTIHTEKNHLHCHLMISSNEINSDTRQRLSKEQFNQIQKEIESYKIEKFPELKDKILYNKEKVRNKYQSAKSKDQEEQFKHRSKKPSRSEELKEIISKILTSSFTVKEFENTLNSLNLGLYKRGETYGIIDKTTAENTKYRLKRLDSQEQFENLLAFEKVRENEIESIKKIQQKSKEIEKER